MKTDDLRHKSEDQLKGELIGLRKEAFNLRFQRATGQLENTARVGQVRRDIARIKTILKEQRKASSELRDDAGEPRGRAEGRL